jgi:hypothetical protein
MSKKIISGAVYETRKGDFIHIEEISDECLVTMMCLGGQNKSQVKLDLEEALKMANEQDWGFVGPISKAS